VAHRTGAIETKGLERVVVDTTVQENAVAHPTDARLTHRAIEKLVDLAKRAGVELRQSYRRGGKRAVIMLGRHTHAHQLKRARRELKFLRVRFGRIIRIPPPRAAFPDRFIESGPLPPPCSALDERHDAAHIRDVASHIWSTIGLKLRSREAGSMSVSRRTPTALERRG
jgi:hypothetical protein